jgi:hypothetical protein
MACTEGHHLPAFRLATIDWQATFATAIVEASANRQAQWWRGWDDDPYIRAIGYWCDHLWHPTDFEKRAGLLARPKIRFGR